MYLRPADIRFMTGTGLSPTNHLSSPHTPTAEVVRQARQSHGRSPLLRLFGKLLLKIGRGLEHTGQHWTCVAVRLGR